MLKLQFNQTWKHIDSFTPVIYFISSSVLSMSKPTNTALVRSRMVSLGGGVGTDQAAADALVSNLVKYGYCYVKHPLFTAERISRAKVMGRGLFTDIIPTKLSDRQREAISTDIGFRGLYQYVGASGKEDHIRCFSVGRPDVEDVASLRSGYFASAGWEPSEFMPKLSQPNPPEIFDSTDEDIKATAKELEMLYTDCHTVSMDALRHVAAALGIKPSMDEVRPSPDGVVDYDYFTPYHSNKDNNLEIKFYPNVVKERKSLVDVKMVAGQEQGAATTAPKVLRRKTASVTPTPQPAAPTQAASVAAPEPSSPKVRLDTHKDLSTVTLLFQDELGGLEVLDSEVGDFVPVPVLQDCVLLNAGIFLEKWTDGVIDGTPHRVRTTHADAASRSRCSIVYFVFPNFDAEIDPFTTRGEFDPTDKSNPPFTAGDLMPPP